MNQKRKKSPRLASMDRANQIAEERLQLIEDYSTLLQAHGRSAAARQLGCSRQTLDRYLHAFQSGGFQALRPAWHRSGRRHTKRFSSVLTEEVIASVRTLTVTRGSVEKAWRAYARQPDCPAAISNWFRCHRRCPAELISAVGLVRREITVFTDFQGFFAVPPQPTDTHE
ncbi:helix-turn-helix domain-containing protein [bacterium]|nr:helix-turn-helix domain-containing protein [bacterium]